MKNEPVFLTDKNHNIVLEALSPAPNAALPDSCKPFEILEPTTAEGAAEKTSSGSGAKWTPCDSQGWKHFPSHGPGAQHRMGVPCDESRLYHARSTDP